MASAKITFGLVTPANETLAGRVDALARRVAEQVGVEIELRGAASYEALADDVKGGAVDLAWLPPIVFLRLGDAVAPVGSIRRGGRDSYEAALIVRADSDIHAIESLKGARAGWVDRWSAAGFVVPRIKLALLGVDPRTAFRTETFHGSHSAAVRALLDGAADVVGTYALADASGEVTSGAWSDVEGADIRVLATFGAIPSDVLVTRAGLDAAVRARIFEGFTSVTDDGETAEVLRAVFGGHELVLGIESSYAALKSALEVASSRGLFE
ncbi:MAG: PhnD/SsuA/transferrin family substrate-binding protein [Myxococcales bacterium]|nr:PhnD/SsuA/transferrin family substrate-binding protein [Myxococcales bacterium]